MPVGSGAQRRGGRARALRHGSVAADAPSIASTSCVAVAAGASSIARAPPAAILSSLYHHSTSPSIASCGRPVRCLDEPRTDGYGHPSAALSSALRRPLLPQPRAPAPLLVRPRPQAPLAFILNTGGCERPSAASSSVLRRPELRSPSAPSSRALPSAVPASCRPELRRPSSCHPQPQAPPPSSECQGCGRPLHRLELRPPLPRALQPPRPQAPRAPPSTAPSYRRPELRPPPSPSPPTPPAIFPPR